MTTETQNGELILWECDPYLYGCHNDVTQQKFNTRYQTGHTVFVRNSKSTYVHVRREIGKRIWWVEKVIE